MLGIGLSPTRLAQKVFGEKSGNEIYKINGVSPKVVWDFAESYMSHALPTLSRSGQASYIDANGRLQIAQSDEPRFDYSTGTRSLLIEDAGINICTSASTPALDGSVYATGEAILSVKDSTAGLIPLGLDQATSGKVFCIDNSMGSHYCFCVINGAPTGSDQYIASAYTRLVSGPGGQSTVRIDGAASNQSANIASSTFGLYETAASTPGNSKRMLLRVEAGNVIEFVLPFYRPVGQRGGYVPNAGNGTGARGADQLTISGITYGLPQDQLMKFETSAQGFTAKLSLGSHLLGAGSYRLIQDWY